MNWSQIVGLDSAKQALLLLAVDPTLGGVVLAASVGSGKSTLARAFAALLPPSTPFVELPSNVTEDRLLGGLDLEVTLATGQRTMQHGLLSNANGGVLYADGLNLLDDAVTAQMMDVMSRGEVRVERDGISATHAAMFMLVGTYDRTDGEVRQGLLDRVGLIVPFVANNEVQARAEVVRRNQENGEWRLEIDDDDEIDMLRGMILFAREQLPLVVISDEQLRGIAETALALGVQGNRVDVFVAKAAAAHAALGGRLDVDDEDLKLAAKLVLMPRATRQPERDDAQTDKKPEPPSQKSDEKNERDETNPPKPEEEPEVREMMLDAVESALPANVLALPFAQQRKGKSGGRGSQLNNKRGRFVRAVPGELRGHKLAFLPTVMAAVPWQRLRRNEEMKRWGDDGVRRWGDKDIFLTPSPPHLLILRSADVRVKKFRDKAGTLFIFVVDASGSMALNRMRQAKGAVAKLLQNAYVHRDQVALVSFRGQAAHVLLPPSQSVERAKRELDVLPTGGSTPLAHALWLAWQTAAQARRKNIHNVMLVLMTDGRGNVPMQETRRRGDEEMRTYPASPHPITPSSLKHQIEDELKGLSALISADGVRAVVIDTQVNYLSRGEAPKLATWLAGKYVYLPNAKAEQIADVVGD